MIYILRAVRQYNAMHLWMVTALLFIHFFHLYRISEKLTLSNVLANSWNTNLRIILWSYVHSNVLSLNAIKLVNSLRLRKNGRHFPDDIFKCIFLNESIWISFEISLKFVPKGPINNIPALVQIMAWRRPGHEPLSELMLVCLLTHICVTRHQWVKSWLNILMA